MSAKKSIRLFVSLSIACGFLFLIQRQVVVDEFKLAILHANWLSYFVAMGLFFCGYACRIVRWKLMLSRENASLGWRDCAGPFFSSIAVNNVLPFRAGDLLRSFAFNRRLGITPGTAVSTIFAERLLDLFALLLALSVALIYFELDAGVFLHLSAIMTWIAALGVFLVLNFPVVFKPLLLGLANFVARYFHGWGNKLYREVDKGLVTLQHLAQAHIMARLLAWTLLAWIFEGWVFWFTAASLASISHVNAAWLAFPVGTLATLIPSTPGYVGTFDYFTMISMTSLNNSASAATAFALLIHMALWLPPTITGAIYLFLHPVTQQEKANS